MAVLLYISAIFVLFIVFLYVAESIHRLGIGHSWSQYSVFRLHIMMLMSYVNIVI